MPRMMMVQDLRQVWVWEQETTALGAGKLGHDQPALGGNGSTVDIQLAIERVISVRTYIAHISISPSTSGRLFCTS